MNRVRHCSLMAWTWDLDDWRLGSSLEALEIDLETWPLTWSIYWVGSQEACLLVLAWELIVTDDVASWDDDQTDGYAVAVTVPYFILLASWVLHTLRVGFLKPLLVGSKRTQVGSCTRVGALIFSWNWKDLRRLKSSASQQLIVSNGFYQWIMIEFSIYIWCTLST